MILGHESNYVQVYSNSWGPSDLGFIVDGPDVLARRNFEIATAQVSKFKINWCFWIAKY